MPIAKKPSNPGSNCPTCCSSVASWTRQSACCARTWRPAWRSELCHPITRTTERNRGRIGPWTRIGKQKLSSRIKNCRAAVVTCVCWLDPRPCQFRRRQRLYPAVQDQIVRHAAAAWQAGRSREPAAREPGDLPGAQSFVTRSLVSPCMGRGGLVVLFVTRRPRTARVNVARVCSQQVLRLAGPTRLAHRTLSTTESNRGHIGPWTRIGKQKLSSRVKNCRAAVVTCVCWLDPRPCQLRRSPAIQDQIVRHAAAAWPAGRGRALAAREPGDLPGAQSFVTRSLVSPCMGRGGLVVLFVTRRPRTARVNVARVCSQQVLRLAGPTRLAHRTLSTTESNRGRIGPWTRIGKQKLSSRIKNCRAAVVTCVCWLDPRPCQFRRRQRLYPAVQDQIVRHAAAAWPAGRSRALAAREPGDLPGARSVVTRLLVSLCIGGLVDVPGNTLL